MASPTPRVEIRVDRLVDNAAALLSLCMSRGVELTAVTKATGGSPRIASALRACGIRSFGDSRIANLRRMRESGLAARYVLIRSPAPSEAEAAVEWADLSLNTEISVVKRLGRAARARGAVHGVILMVELGDLREGIPPAELDDAVRQVLHVDGIELSGIGTNLACLGGVRPSPQKMNDLSSLTAAVEHRYGIRLRYVSGGNSANYGWLASTPDTGRVNHLRMGESLLLGCDALTRKPIPGLHTDAFTVVAEVIEVKTKPSLPEGEIVQDAFGHHPRFPDRGRRRRAILAIGRQDIEPATLRPRVPAQIIGATSDHLVLDATEANLEVGDEVAFDVGYSSLLRAMASRDVARVFQSEPDLPHTGVTRVPCRASHGSGTS